MSYLSRVFPVGKFVALEGGAVYHTTECICIKMMPYDFTLYITDTKPDDLPWCKECETNTTRRMPTTSIAPK
jgi:hypothetical protein